MKRVRLRVEAAQAGERLDKFLAATSGLSRGACRRAIAEGGVWLDRKRLRRLSLPVEAGWLLEIVTDDAAGGSKGDAPTPTVLFEDAAILAVDKPAGLPSQGTLASDQRSVLGWAETTRRNVRTIHRLDIGTSGVQLLAKTADAATALGAQFREGTVEKTYLAIGVGDLPRESGVLDQPLRKAKRQGSQEVAPTGQGVPAETHYRVLARRPPLLLVEAVPRTGRTHQIRVHLAAAGAPLLGDTRYGGPLQVAFGDKTAHATRPLLHAAALVFDHPQSGKRTRFESAPPGDFKAVEALIR